MTIYDLVDSFGHEYIYELQIFEDGVGLVKAKLIKDSCDIPQDYADKKIMFWDVGIYDEGDDMLYLEVWIYERICN